MAPSSRHRLRSISSALACASLLLGCSSSSVAPSPSASVAPSATPLPSAKVATPAAPVTGNRACVAKGPGRFARVNVSATSSAVDLLAPKGELAGKTPALVALVADADEHAIHTIDARSLEELAVTPLDGEPHDVLVLADGRIAVTLRDRAEVLVLEPGAELAAPLEERCRADVAPEPWALAETPDRLLVTSAFGASLALFRPADMALLRTIALAREPRAVVVDPAGKIAYVAHATGGRVTAVDLDDPATEPVAIDLRAGRKLKLDGETDDRPRDATQAYALARLAPKAPKAGETWRLLVPHTTVDSGIAGSGVSNVSYGAGADVAPVAPIVGVVDPATKKLVTTSAAQSRVGMGDCVLPRSALVRNDRLYVACMDVGAVLELDPWLSDPMMGLTRRFAVGAGPIALAATGDSGQLFVWSSLDRALSRVDLDAKGDKAPTSSMTPWQRAGEKRDPVLERGRRLFVTTDDVRISSGRACASCHPEGRDDGLVWSSPDGARQTPMLAGRLEGTAPYGWFGDNPTLHDHLEKTFQRLGGTGLGSPGDKADFDALIAYVSSLPAPPSARAPVDGAEVARGKAVYVAAGCAGCHKEGGTDAKVHDVGSGVKGEKKSSFDTPSLRGIRGSAPYFHDGRYATLEAVLTDANSKMFDPSTVSDPDRRALIAYLETL